MAKPVRFRAYSAGGGVVDSGSVKNGVAKVKPARSDATLVVFYTGAQGSEYVIGSADVRIPVGMALEVAWIE